MTANIDINIDNLRQTAQTQRTKSQGRRLTDYIYARDELFDKIIKNAKTKMNAAAEAGHYRAILMSGHRNNYHEEECGLYPQEMFFGANELEGRKGIPFPSVWNPTGIPEEHTLLTKLRRAFHVEKNQNLRFYVKRDLRNALHFHVFVDWSPRYRSSVSVSTDFTEKQPQQESHQTVLTANQESEPTRTIMREGSQEREGGYIQPRSRTIRNAVQVDDDGFIMAVGRKGGRM